MNNKLRTTLLGGLLSASIATPALAGDFSTPIQLDAAPPVTAPPAGPTSGLIGLPTVGSDAFSFSAGYHSSYIFRGINFGDDMLDASLETTVNLAGIDFTAGVWSANVINPGANTDLESNVYASTAKDFGYASVEVGYILYYFDRDTAGNTQELYLGLTGEVGGFAVSATYYWDFDLADSDKDTYLELGVEQTITIGKFGDFNAAVVVGMNPGEGEFTHAQATLSQSINLTDTISLTPYASYSHAMQDVDSYGNVRDDEFIAGATVGFTF